MKIKIMLLIVFSLIGAQFLFYSCEKTNEVELALPLSPTNPGPIVDPVDEGTTWGKLQKQILDKHCVSCHTAGNSFAIQSDLVLTADVAYEQLVGRVPKNAKAREDGLLLVGTRGLESIHRSFLWEKINAPNQEHFYSDHPEYGALMPQGAPPLTNGEIKFIEEWIKAGASQTDSSVSAGILADTTRFAAREFEALPLPVSGIQVHVGPFDVQPNFEREFFFYEPLYNNEDIYVNRVEMIMRSGSHHFIAYGFQDNTPGSVFQFLDSRIREIRDIRDPNGNIIIANLLPSLYHQFISGTQWPLMNYSFPPGVALRVPANTRLDLNPHYVNRTNDVFQGEIYANFHTIDRSQVDRVADILFLNNGDINLPPNRVTTLQKSYSFNEKRHFFQLFSHAHEHMLEFRVYVEGGPRDGELVYISYDWEHPPILELDPPLVLEPGQGLRMETTYNNWTSRTLQFGLLSEDEMMILFGYYYTE